MKAAVLTQWERIEIHDVPIPETGQGECLIRVKYAGICGSDLHIYKGHHPTAKAPVIPGHEFVGVVEKINSSKRTDIRPGDRVVAEPLISCGGCEACLEGNRHVCRNLKLVGIHTDGGFAEYVNVSADKVIKVDESVPDRIAALAEPFAVGFHVNRRAGVKNGDNVLVIGAGPIGLVVGITAKAGGASSVVYSEINTDRIEQVKSFGFTDVINPVAEDALKKADELTDHAGFDVVFEVSGSQPGILFATQACKIRGTIVPVGFPAKIPEFNLLQCIFKELSVIGSRVYTFQDFIKTVKMLENIVKNKAYNLDRLISGTFRLEELEKALSIMERGENTGKILIEM